MLYLRSILRRLRATSGASLVEYALLTGLIAVVAVAATSTLGGKINRIFETASSQIDLAIAGLPLGEEEPTGTLPTIEITTTLGFINPFEPWTNVSWTIQDSTSVSLQADYSGSCPNDSVVIPPEVQSDTGSFDVHWDSFGAGCTYSVTLTATNDNGSASETATVTFAGE